MSWDDIAGLEHAKAVVQEVAVWPLLAPTLFRGARAVPRGILLFGPPGTGKARQRPATHRCHVMPRTDAQRAPVLSLRR